MNVFSLLRQRRFSALFLTQFMGAFNDNVYKNALLILIAYRGAELFGYPTTQTVVIGSGIFILPFFIFSTLSGQLADRFEKSHLVKIVKLAEIIIMSLAAFAVILEWPYTLMILLFFMGAQSTFFGPLKFGLLPEHLKSNELVGGNALIEAGTFLAILTGTVVGGLIVVTSGATNWALATSVVLFAIFGWVFSLFIPASIPANPSLKIHFSPFRPAYEMLKLAAADKQILLSTLGIAWFWFFGASILSLLPTYSSDTLNVDKSVVTLFLSAFSVGIAAGSILCEKISTTQLSLKLISISLLGFSIFTVDLYIIGKQNFELIGVFEFITKPMGLRILADLCLIACAGGLFTVPLYALIQRRAEKKIRARVIAASNLTNAFFMVCSAILLFGLVSLGLEPQHLFGVLGGLNLMVTVALYLFGRNVLGR